VAQPQRAARKEPKSTGEVVSELWGLVKDYGTQEVVDPVKNLGRFIAYGSAAAFCFAIAGLLFAVAFMRIIQVEGRRWFHGNWTFVPYVIAIFFCLVAAFLSYKQIKAGKHGDDSSSAKAKKGKAS